jgi:hypothetical protein
MRSKGIWGRPGDGLAATGWLWRVALVLVVLAVAGTMPAAAARPAEQAADDLNLALLKVYREAKAVRLAKTSPVIVAAFDELVLIRDGSERRAEITPRAYDSAKDMSHTVLGFYGAAALAMAEPAGDWAADLRTLRAQASAMLPRLAALGFAADRLERQTRLLTGAIAFADRALAAGAVTQAELTGYARQAAPFVLANAADAAAAQVDTLHAVVQQWRGEMTEAEWKRLYVVVLGARMPRVGNLQFQYFANALGPGAIDERLFYAEGIFDVKGGLDLLATIITDRELSATVFDDRLRMDRDLLADGAQAHLLQLFGRLGAVPGAAKTP